MLPHRVSLVVSPRCSVFPADSRFPSAGYIFSLVAAPCICCVCCFVSCPFGFIAPLRLPGCCSVVLFHPRFLVSLRRCVFSIASPRCGCSVVSPFSRLALCARASNLRSWPLPFASGSGSYSLCLRAINALMPLGDTSRKICRIAEYC